MKDVPYINDMFTDNKIQFDIIDLDKKTPFIRKKQLIQ